jgi:hypothetical protein
VVAGSIVATSDGDAAATTSGDPSTTDTVVQATPAPTTAVPTPSPTLFGDSKELMHFLVSAFSDGQAPLANSSSPQHQAFLWLAENRGVRQSAKASLQKFALASFYSAQWIRLDSIGGMAGGGWHLRLRGSTIWLAGVWFKLPLVRQCPGNSSSLQQPEGHRQKFNC